MSRWKPGHVPVDAGEGFDQRGETFLGPQDTHGLEIDNVRP